MPALPTGQGQGAGDLEQMCCAGSLEETTPQKSHERNPFKHFVDKNIKRLCLGSDSTIHEKPIKNFHVFRQISWFHDCLQQPSVVAMEASESIKE